MSLDQHDIGFKQTLRVVTVDESGVELGPRRLWLAADELEAPVQLGDEITVFIASDRDGQPFATTRLPFAEAGEFAYLEVVDVAPHGAYLAWGLPRDLFVPHFLLFDDARIGQRLMVAVDVDERGRLFGSNRLREYFDPDPSDLEVGQQVDLWVYGRSPRGWRVIVDSTYAGMLFDDQVFQPLAIGQRLTGWVHALHEDGQVDASLRRTGPNAIQDAREVVWAALLEADGFLGLTDRSPPEAIRGQLGLSKKAFKRAVGGLYKDGRIELGEQGVRAVVDRT